MVPESTTMSDSVLREAFSVMLKEFLITGDFLKLVHSRSKGAIKERIKNRIDGLEVSAKKIEEILGSK
jgi:hypothetical protein